MLIKASSTHYHFTLRLLCFYALEIVCEYGRAATAKGYKATSHLQAQQITHLLMYTHMSRCYIVHDLLTCISSGKLGYPLMIQDACCMLA